MKSDQTHTSKYPNLIKTKLALLPLAIITAFLGGCGSSTSSSDTSTGSDDSSSSVIEDSTVRDIIVDSFPALIINEIVAKAKAIDNGNAQGYDWIELYVSGTESINLGDYSLIDDDTEELQPLPAITLAPGEFYTLYATTDESLDVTNKVAFKLGSSDSVSLFKGDDLINKLEWNKGEALYGFSYGHFPDATGEAQSLTPSFNATNITATRGPLVINEVLAKDANGGNDWFELYNNGSTSINLSLYSIIDESDDIDAVALPNISLAPDDYVRIYATTEDPGANYVAFKLGSSESLSLILNDETVDYLEWDDSDAPEAYSYGAYPDGAWRSSTLIPSLEASNTLASAFNTETVENIYIEMSNDDWSDMITNALDEEEHVASVSYLGVNLENISIRTKGNSSLSAVANSNGERFSFKLDMNEYVSGQKLLNLKKLNLNNNYKDPTYMRETIAYNLMREMGVPAPRTSYANLYINGELHGLYTLVEQVDGEFLEQQFANSEGDLYKPDSTGITNGVGNDLKWINSDFASYSAIELKTNEDSSDNQALIQFLDELNNGNGNINDYESVLNVDGLLRYLAVSTALGNMDSYQGPLAHNFYIYDNSNQFSIIPWDMNESFGTFAMGCNATDITNLLIDEPTSTALSDRPLIANLLQNSGYVDTYHDYLSDLINGGLDPDTLATTITEIADLIRSSVYDDPTAFYTSSEFEAALNSDVGAIPGLLSFATARVNSIQNQLDGTVASSGDGSGSCSANSGTPPTDGTPPEGGGPNGPPPM